MPVGHSFILAWFLGFLLLGSLSGAFFDLVDTIAGTKRPRWAERISRRLRMPSTANDTSSAIVGCWGMATMMAVMAIIVTGVSITGS